MSINSAMLSGVSGLIANSSALAAISDNIANVNTVAYKRSQVNFANIVTAQAVTGRYSAGGVQGITRSFIGTQGLIQSATSPTDLGIAGDGFFIVTEKGNGLTTQDTRAFTRSGSFSVDADGFLVNDSKFYLQGWPVNPDETVDVNPSDLTMLEPINVRNLGTAVTATSNVAINAILDKTTPVSAAVTAATYSPAAGASMADYADDPATGTRPDFSIPMRITDSAGAARNITISFLRKDPAVAPNEWYAEVYATPASDVSVAGAPGQILSGTVAFDSNGEFDLANTDLFGALGDEPSFLLNGSGSGVQPQWADAEGINEQPITLDLTKLSQLATKSTAKQINPDGTPTGNVIGVEVDENGFVSAIFDNSEVRKIAKIGIATFPNPDGLQAISGNAYRPTNSSGEYVIKEPGEGGAGRIAPSTLEASTVDLSAEFTGLITTQKAYSASSKIITTADQMLEELINIKR
jgi:flagellar hook protein FlgE